MHRLLRRTLFIGSAALGGDVLRESKSCSRGPAQASGGSSGSGQSQYATLFNTTVQSANGSIFNIQANIFAPVFVGSPGAGSGDVRQSNVASNRASAANLNRTFQLLLQGAGIHVLRV